MNTHVSGVVTNLLVASLPIVANCPVELAPSKSMLAAPSVRVVLNLRTSLPLASSLESSVLGIMKPPKVNFKASNPGINKLLVWVMKASSSTVH